jgi:arylsulfatase A-like enzyme
VSTLDLLPTVLELAAKPSAPAPTTKLDGVSLAPLLRGKSETLQRDTLVWRLGEHYAVRRGDWKLVQFADHPPMLFDLARDPGERKNLAASEAARVGELERIYRGWAAQTVAPLWTTRQDLWVRLQDILDGKPLRTLDGPGPGVVRLPI